MTPLHVMARGTSERRRSGEAVGAIRLPYAALCERIVRWCTREVETGSTDFVFRAAERYFPNDPRGVLKVALVLIAHANACERETNVLRTWTQSALSEARQARRLAWSERQVA